MIFRVKKVSEKCIQREKFEKFEFLPYFLPGRGAEGLFEARKLER